MKQETIDFIKSMTSQGLLVVVDAETHNGDIITITCSKKPEDEQHLKEEPKPEIDLSQCDGLRFRAKIQGVACKGKIRVCDDIDYGVYLCNDKKDNAWKDVDKLGYRGAWFMRTDRSDFNTSITDFELLPEPRVIFTNCVGEVFTEEDVKKNIEVWVGSISGKGLNRILNCPICDLTRDIFRGDDYETDIFRSKKSLLKYLYETCD